MDLLTALKNTSDYSKNQLQMIVGAWVLTGAVERKAKIDTTKGGDVAEGDYDKRSIYSLLYALYRSMGEVSSETGEKYEFTFNTWGYAWPKAWGEAPTTAADPQRFGKNAYSGLFHFDAVKKYVKAKAGKVHVTEMGCGTGAGAHHVCTKVLPEATYEAVDMQQAGIATCERKFVPQLRGRLRATCADATNLPVLDASSDFVAVNETHVNEFRGRVTPEDEAFFHTAKRILKPGGFMVWGNAIPASTWGPSIDYLSSIGIKLVEECDVTKEAIQARDEDKARIDTYAAQCIEAFHGFKIPLLGKKKIQEADWALKNFARNPGTRLYDNMVEGIDAYKCVLLQEQA
jgi:ubiquinone/menaquinone biosynthesis C-methylase UbiE